MCCFHIYYRYYKNVTTGIVLQRKEVVNFFLSHFLLHLFLPQKTVLSASFQNKDTDKTFIYLIIYAKTLRSAYTKEM